MPWMRNYIYFKQWDVITQPHANFNGLVKMPLNRMDE